MTLAPLDESHIATDPFQQFDRWFAEAKLGEREPQAMTVATATPDGRPTARILYLKQHDGRRFIFFGNYGSRKGEELALNPQCCLLFYWPLAWRQVRIEGRVERVEPDVSDEYFASRPRGSQLGAWASQQSRRITDREALERQVAEVQARFDEQPVKRPPFWGGWALTPERIEFFQGRENRLHDRLVYVREGEGWHVERIQP